MATYASNTTIKSDGAVVLNASNSTQSYTVPANSYVVLGVCRCSIGLTGPGVSASLYISGVEVISVINSGDEKIYGGIHVGSGQTITVNSNNKFATAFATGALFRNTP